MTTGSQNKFDMTTETDMSTNDKIIAELKQLPPTEFSHYIAVLVGTIENEREAEPEKYALMLESTLKLTKSLRDFYNNPLKDNVLNDQEVLVALNELVGASKFETPSHKVKKALMKVCSSILSVFIGIFGGIAGFTIGLFSDYTVIGNFRGAYLGLVMGLGVGIHVGTNLPNKMFQSGIEQKLEFTISSIQRITGELNSRKTIEVYREETKQYVMETFFKNLLPEEREAAFAEFLSKPQKFQVCSTAAAFISPHLKGHLGQHSLIRFNVEGLAETQTMEFNPSDRAPKFVNQYEDERTVPGEKFFDMLVLNRILQETHEFSLGFVLGTYEVGSNDCLTFVNKLLIGTGQPPTEMQRFNPEVDKWTSTNLIAPIMGFFSRTNGTELKPFLKHYEDGNHPEMHHQKWTKKPQPQPAEPEPNLDETPQPNPGLPC